MFNLDSISTSEEFFCLVKTCNVWVLCPNICLESSLNSLHKNNTNNPTRRTLLLSELNCTWKLAFKNWKKLILDISLSVYQPTTLAGLEIFSWWITKPLFQFSSNYALFRQLISRDYLITITLKIDHLYHVSYSICSIGYSEGRAIHDSMKL